MQLPILKLPTVRGDPKQRRLQSQICQHQMSKVVGQGKVKKLSINIHKEKKIGYSRMEQKDSDIELMGCDKMISQRVRKVQNDVSVYVIDPLLNGRIRNQRETVFENLVRESNQFRFLVTVEKYQFEFIKQCINKDYKEAEEKILQLLNYAIDLNLIDYLCFSLKILGDFHLHCHKIEKAFFYYNQGRKCALLIDQPTVMIDCLFQMSVCANKGNMFGQSIRFLKKALQYIWFLDLVNMQLKVYDDIGKIYYLMGDAQKAKNYHHRYFSGMSEPKESSSRMLSMEVLIREGFQQKKPQRLVNSILLWMVSIPVISCENLAEFGVGNGVQGNQCSPRNQLIKNMKDFNQFQPLKTAIQKVLDEQLFSNQIAEIENSTTDWTLPNRQKKYLSFDIQRNRYLHHRGIPFQRYFGKNRDLDLKKSGKNILVEPLLKEHSHSTEEKSGKNVEVWYNNMVSETIKRHRNFNQSIHSRVQLRGWISRWSQRCRVFG